MSNPVHNTPSLNAPPPNALSLALFGPNVSTFLKNLSKCLPELPRRSKVAPPCLLPIPVICIASALLPFFQRLAALINLSLLTTTAGGTTI